MEGPSGCWEWIGSKDQDGYGLVTIGHVTHRVHRLMYALFVGTLHKGQLVCHSCDTTNCVNPEHLFAGTNADNMKDKVGKGRQTQGTGFGDRCKLTVQDVLKIRGIENLNKTTADIAREIGHSYPTVYDARVGKTWKGI